MKEINFKTFRKGQVAFLMCLRCLCPSDSQFRTHGVVSFVICVNAHLLTHPQPCYILLFHAKCSARGEAQLASLLSPLSHRLHHISVLSVGNIFTCCKEPSSEGLLHIKSKKLFLYCFQAILNEKLPYLLSSSPLPCAPVAFEPQLKQTA